ncbi:transcriptional regulator, SarA/Rot family [Nicoliella lavandulae]|uniref:Winged helix DNA-binding protein n=1 Tax=Nicoliella lavandulae TaxID=3082954 RepID=A0ABU8SMN7_9LACO
MQNNNSAAEIIKQIGKMLNQDGTNDNEKQWMIKQLTDHITVQDQLKQLTTKDIHTISIVNRQTTVHVKSLPKLTNFSQPTISRIITKLAQQQLLEKFRTTKNDKEILVRLTSAGREIANVHQQLEQHLHEQVSAILSQYPAAEIDDFINIITQIAQIKP